MGVFARPDSPFYWILLEGTGPPAERESTRIPVTGGTEFQTKQNKKLAQEAYAARMGDLARGRYTLPVDLPSRRFLEHASWYFDTLSAMKGGTSKEKSMLRKLGLYWNRFELAAVTMEDGLNWRKWRSEQVSFSTVNREMALLKHIFSTAIPKYLTASPLKGLGELDQEETEIRILSAREEQTLLRHCTTLEERTLLITGLDTLQRLGSVTKLHWSDHKGRQLRFMNAKVKSQTRAGHDVEISKRLAASLVKLRRQQKATATDPIFPSFYSVSPQKRRTLVWTMMRARCATAGLPVNRLKGGISFHCLRHTGATRMLRRGVDPKTVMQIGGWRKIDQVLKYMHTDRDRQRTAVNTIAGRSRKRA